MVDFYYNGELDKFFFCILFLFGYFSKVFKVIRKCINLGI